MTKPHATKAHPRRTAGLMARSVASQLKPGTTPAHMPGVTEDYLRTDHAHPLHTIFSPRNVAVIGATEAPGSVGRTVLENLRAGSYRGELFPVNPKRPTVLGLPADEHWGDSQASGSGHHCDARQDGSWNCGGVREGRCAGLHHSVCGLQGGGTGRRGARAPGSCGGAQGEAAGDRAELH